ncbi:MAG: hypothetical protein P4L99_02360 [Chthoniobacter sp.]|nr:hypothetical protein [Chthoniobacter sp.]
MSYPRSAPLFSYLAAFVLALPAVYLLSMGPLWGLATRHPERYGAATLLYWPVVRIAEEHPAFDGWISAYVEQWYPKDVSHRGSITMKRMGNASPPPEAAP